LDLKEKALFNIKLHDALRKTPQTLTSMCQGIFSLIGLFAIIIRLSPLLILVIMALIALNTLIYKNIQKTKSQFYQDIAIYNRQFQYYQGLSQDFSNAKDMRIYNMSKYILTRIDVYQSKINKIFFKMFRKQRNHDGLSSVNLQIQSIIGYSYASWSVLTSTIGIGDFAMFIAAINSFSNNMSQFVTHFIESRHLSKVLSDYLKFEQITNNQSNGIMSTGGAENIKIEFRDVWFRYPGTENFALKNISVVINQGEKLSIVGQNGAGKTTFIKLLCRLYQPNKGKILLNGVNINEYDYAEYIKLLAVLFQDYKMFSFTIKENISFDQAASAEEIYLSLLVS